MRQFDFTPYRRSTIGFDRLFDMLEASARQASSQNYPPFNLERLAEDRYRITLVVAGFKPEAGIRFIQMSRAAACICGCRASPFRVRRKTA